MEEKGKRMFGHDNVKTESEIFIKMLEVSSLLDVTSKKQIKFGKNLIFFWQNKTKHFLKKIVPDRAAAHSAVWCCHVIRSYGDVLNCCDSTAISGEVVLTLPLAWLLPIAVVRLHVVGWVGVLEHW